MYPVYYVVEGDTLPILFHTFSSDDPSASITLTGLAATDIEIYKDGGTTTRASDSGYALLGTDGIDEFGTGIHGFSIDLSDNSDAGFYAVGPWYHVVVASVTVDGATINFIAAAFRILDATRGMAGTALPDAAADAAGGVPVSDAGGLDLDTLDSNVTAALADTNEVQGDLADGGRLDLLIDAILADTNELQSDDYPTALTAIETDTQDIQSRIPAALVNSRIDATIDATGFEAGAVDLIFDEPLSGHTTAKTFGALLASAVFGTVDNSAHTPTSTEFEADDITEATADHFIGRNVYFLTGVLAGQGTDITDYALSGSNGHFTVTAMTEAPGNNDTFVIL